MCLLRETADAMLLSVYRATELPLQVTLQGVIVVWLIQTAIKNNRHYFYIIGATVISLNNN
jgi:hypothetical protein